MRLHRLLGILTLLDSRKTITASKLAKILETSERTIYRDIDILCESGIPITSSSGPSGGFSLMDDYDLSLNTMKGSDALYLMLSGMGVHPQKNTQMYQSVQNAFLKLESTVSDEHKEEIIRAKEKFLVDFKPWWGEDICEDNIDIIKQAVLELRKLNVKYEKYNEESSQRVLSPYGVVVKNSQWYLVAKCHLKNEVRIFKCSRLKEIELLDETFEIPKSFDLERFWQQSKTMFVKKTAVTVSAPSYSVKLELDANDSESLKGFIVISTSASKGRLTYELDMISFSTACNILFPLSDRIKVIAPAELKSWIEDKAKNILKLNSSL